MPARWTVRSPWAPLAVFLLAVGCAPDPVVVPEDVTRLVAVSGVADQAGLLPQRLASEAAAAVEEGFGGRIQEAVHGRSLAEEMHRAVAGAVEAASPAARVAEAVATGLRPEQRAVLLAWYGSEPGRESVRREAAAVRAGPPGVDEVAGDAEEDGDTEPPVPKAIADRRARLDAVFHRLEATHGHARRSAAVSLAFQRSFLLAVVREVPGFRAVPAELAAEPTAAAVAASRDRLRAVFHRALAEAPEPLFQAWVAQSETPEARAYSDAVYRGLAVALREAGTAAGRSFGREWQRRRITDNVLGL